MATFLERFRRDPARVRLDRLERLQGVAEELAAAQTRDEVLRVVSEHALSLVEASAAMLYWERSPGVLALVHGIGVSDELVQRFREIGADDRLPVAAAYRTGQPLWLPDRSAIAAGCPELVGLVERAGANAWAALPVVAAGGRGAVGLEFQDRRAFDQEERNFVLAAARQCVAALDRARLFDASNRLAERLRQLLGTASALSSAGTAADVAAGAFRALGALGACAAEIHGLEGSDRIALLARHGRASSPQGAPVAIDAPTPAADVVRTGKAIWLESPEEIAQRYPHLERERAAREERAWAVVPLLASGQALGALAAIFPEPRRLEPDDRTYVRLVAQPCAQALDRARLFQDALRARAEAEATASLLSAMCVAAPVGLALLDREMRFVKVNDDFARLDGVPASAHPGRTPQELLPDAPHDRIAAAFRDVLATGVAAEHELEAEVPAAPGIRSRFATSWFPVRVRGEVAGVGVLVRGRT